MLHPENIPSWLWQLFAACGIVFAVIFTVQRRRRRIRDNIREAYYARHAARAKAWRWLFGQPRVKRLSYRQPDDKSHD